ncbi:MAG: hypothetical protein VCA57_01815 [Pseudomonas sp.]|uniref:hypothetical protein n=1 Tax=Pseudomonas sp. TaxID=306 RepID=UPI00398197E4
MSWFSPKPAPAPEWQQATDRVENSLTEISARSGEQLTYLGHTRGFLVDSNWQFAPGIHTAASLTAL